MCARNDGARAANYRESTAKLRAPCIVRRKIFGNRRPRGGNLIVIRAPQLAQKFAPAIRLMCGHAGKKNCTSVPTTAHRKLGGDNDNPRTAAPPRGGDGNYFACSMD